MINSSALMMGAEGYTISRSVRLRSSASAYFNRTPASTGNRQIMTFSMWVKLGATTGGTGYLFSANTASGFNDAFGIAFSSGTLDLAATSGGATVCDLNTTQVFRDPSSWYHIVYSIDTTQATSSNRIKLYVNGVQVTAFGTATYPAQNTNLQMNNTVATYIGRLGYTSSALYDGYLTEINFIDGQALTPSSFGETDAVTGVWKPKKYTGTYGTNGFYLNFSDNSAATAAAIGKDYSGNGNNWTPNNISVTAGVTYDSMIDSPTVSASSSNYAVLNPLDAQGTATLSDANLTLASATTAHKNRKATFLIPSSGKWYWELTTASTCSASVILGWGLQTTSAATDSQAGNANTWMAQNDANQDIFNQTTSVLSTGSAVSGGAIRQVAYDADTGKLWFGVNNTWYSSTDLTSGNPSAGTNQCMTLSAGNYFPTITCYNLTANANFGQRPFSYTPPSGFKALNTFNLPTPTIANGATVMAATLWTGDQNARTISNAVNGVSFKPDLVWTKSRSDAESHRLSDSVRGGNGTVLYQLYSNLTNAEGTDTLVSGFASNGFTIAAGANSPNVTGRTYVGWQWQAGQGSTSSNTSGSITSTVSVNATAGFSIVVYTGNGTNGATVGHGLGVKPSLIIEKGRSSGYNWSVQGCGVLWPTATQNLFLNTTNALNAGGAYGAPNSTTFYPSLTNYANENGVSNVAYCFSAVAGYSAFGSYTGNGSTDGPFVYCGFRPAFIMIKRTDTTGNWTIHDNKRLGYNGSSASKELYPNLSNAEGSDSMDQLSNGFKLRDTYTDVNASGGTYIYAAFSETAFRNALAR